MKRSLATAVWAAFVLAAIVVVMFAHYTTDLSAFLPRSPTTTQRLLVDQLREGTKRIQAFIQKLEHEGKIPAVSRA